ncbi:SulP family inorganic anion transporter [Smaragdicoccus niigatensis]|uniref:SulP family inorganic anion transporter n=1 Tax=Smaragdicoccus niigatensis TaxID=359359 RepID=UPI000377B93F|nr:SulP family inorganic anion transporter [Smaragdicoccus niigatensis]
MSFAPGIAQFRDYDRRWLRGDLIGGVTVAAYLVPQVMAYAAVAGVPPVAGLWAAFGPLIVYAVFGSSRNLSVGPESTTALMTSVAVGGVAHGDGERYATIAALMAVIVGVLCLLARVVRLGFLAGLLSKPVLVGYMAGIALMMMSSQLGKITRVHVEGDGFVPEVSSFISQVATVHWPTVGLAAIALTLFLLLSWRWPKLPGPLIGMVLAAAVVWVFGFTDNGIKVVGAIPAGLPAPGFTGVAWSDIPALILPAIGITIVGFSDNVLTARAFAPKDAAPINANAEFAALGMANIASGLMHGFPVSSSGSRTAIAVAMGSRTQLYSLTAMLTIVVALTTARGVLEAFPTAALGALVIFAALRLIEVGEFRRIAKFRRAEFAIALLTTFAVLGLGVLYGIMTAIGLSILELLHRVARPHDGILGYVPGLAGMHDIDDYPDARPVDGLVVYRYDAPLCFANAEDFRSRALAAVDAASYPVKWFVMNAEANVEVDLTSLDMLDDLRRELNERGITFALARVKQDLRESLKAAGMLDRIDDSLIFPTLPTAVEAFHRTEG